ncbi:MAG TPA: hypothetical protein VIH67_13420 [Candidatus Acidoferrum sp.]
MNMRRIGNLTPRIIATLAVLAMLIAPLCAPFCGAHACANSLAKHGDDCHSSSSADYEVPQTGVASNPVCGSSEPPSAVLNEATNALDRVKQGAAVHANANFVLATQSEIAATSGAYYPLPDCQGCNESSSARPAVLRI